MLTPFDFSASLSVVHEHECPLRVEPRVNEREAGLRHVDGVARPRLEHERQALEVRDEAAHHAAQHVQRQEGAKGEVEKLDLGGEVTTRVLFSTS